MPRPKADAIVTAKVLAAAIRKMGPYDLILWAKAALTCLISRLRRGGSTAGPAMLSFVQQN